MKEKYVTKKKRIALLEKEIQQLKTQIQILTSALDAAHEKIYRSRDGLARGIEQDFEKVHPTESPPHPKRHRSSRHSGRNLPLAPRADLVLTRDSQGRLISTPSVHHKFNSCIKEVN